MVEEELLIFLVVVVVPVGGMGLVGMYFARRRAMARRELEESAPLAAIDTFPTIEQVLERPDKWRHQLAGNITLINALSTPVASESTPIELYSVYALDSNGEPHDLLESGDEELAAAAGQWIALLLGVRFQNDTFAKPGIDLNALAREIKGRIAKRRVQHEGHGVLLAIVSVVLAGLTAASYVEAWGLTVDFATGAVVTGLGAGFRLLRRARKF